MRQAARRDANEPAIVEAVQRCGGSVQLLSMKGVPDLLVGHRGRNLLFEVKNPDSDRGRPSTVALNPDQQRWHDAWHGHRVVVCSALDVYRELGWGCVCGHLVHEHKDAGAGPCSWCRGSRRAADNCRAFQPRPVDDGC